MIVRFKFVLLLVVSGLLCACTVNPDPIPGGGDATTMPEDLGSDELRDIPAQADAPDLYDAYMPMSDEGGPGDGPNEGGYEGGLQGDGGGDSDGPTDGGPVDTDPMDTSPATDGHPD